MEMKNQGWKFDFRDHVFFLDIICVAAFHTPGGERGRNLQATRCVLGGKSRVKVVTLFLTPPFRQTPKEAKGVIPYELLRLVT